MRMLKYLLLAAVFCLVASEASAQITYPRSYTVAWDPNVASDNVTHYDVTVNTVATATVQATACTATVCQVTVTLTTAPLNNTAVFSVTAVNLNASSIPSSVTLIIAAPAAVRNMRVTGAGTSK